MVKLRYKYIYIYIYINIQFFLLTFNNFIHYLRACLISTAEKGAHYADAVSSKIAQLIKELHQR